MPEKYGATGFKKDHLLIIPNKLFQNLDRREKKEYKDDLGALKQLKVIQSVFNKCYKIIVAIGAGRVGELIFC